MSGLLPRLVSCYSTSSQNAVLPHDMCLRVCGRLLLNYSGYKWINFVAFRADDARSLVCCASPTGECIRDIANLIPPSNVFLISCSLWHLLPYGLEPVAWNIFRACKLSCLAQVYQETSVRICDGVSCRKVIYRVSLKKHANEFHNLDKNICHTLHITRCIIHNIK